ncbi:heat shock 70 kDa protein 12B-like [Mya arenaria]|uniref:heat shock 70 kDa protein 12B-like n=1 Tax=Mya arenaria TaxID=6604 RepID=UPI0022DEFBC9|nr:heat shock 70 kDa protein 12B-like [Mya arenaria]XP_052760623.1 heat shock 70 kDa protein 12B-like [Mya arenaria]XP_052760624.1 heat shock 70 kDa protein 12B-like [Mya arenaria]XP_052760625.1 heat shock 70 kDa protein 12B-like [Mya arenaria]XP_052760626.1 heat shock 70 kDa protein 12B-like [Mya arenaria]XP_052760628.1 heat shock 70 kDa protein 12B-like [Mya arenaria]
MASNAQSKALLVAAFDFGTTYSGYAFSFQDDPNKIQTNQNWYAGGGASRLVSLKTSTSVLLNPKGEFDKFGFEAEDKYAILAEDDEHNGWRLFRRFKMVLHRNKHLTKDVKVEDFSGKQMTAFPLFVMSIKYLREHLRKAVTTQKIGVEETDIFYVLTVPAIWDDNAKRFMRDAAIEAGVDPKRLKLALEPECASVWCETLGMDMKGAVAFQGSQYMVVDLGGGTADISVLERKPDGTLKEIHKASGGSWGGIYVDENYMKMLNELFGEKALTELRKTEMNDYFDVTREFEHKKRSFDTYKTKQIIVRVSASLRDLAEKYSSKSLEERIASLKVRENAITMRGKDKLKIDTTVVQSWFKRPIDLLIQHLKSLLAEPKIQSVRTVILVGGFGESPYVQERIRNELAGMRVIVPADAGLAVLKGAVRFGHNPVIVSSRIMKYTYGVNGFVKFDEQKHPEEKKVLKNGEWLVKDCFKVYVRVKEEVRVDQQVTMQSLPISKTSLTSVYRTTQEYPEYTTDTGCELLGSIELENSTVIPFNEQKTEDTFMFGDTELLVKTKNITTGKEAFMTFECFK